ncbi:hypothetical protein ACQP25_03925 [Microtetraspora malaysiensis]|uniref:hypothetical protein n=1 Tax=Microtetraspora malaysiensis TaxID=161358 RepID=UPI003D9279C5
MKIAFVPGAADLTLKVDPAMAEPYKLSFDGVLPEVRPVIDEVVVDFPRSFHIGDRRHGGQIVLNAATPWAVEVQGRTARVDADLRELWLAGLDLQGGVEHVHVDLPEPHGRVPVRVAGGAADLTFRRPAGVPVRLAVAGGSTRLTVGGQHFATAPPKYVFTDPGLEESEDRYDILIAGGTDALTLV